MDIDIGLTEAVGFVYTLGVFVTGMWLAGSGLPPLTPYNLGLVLLLAVGWTAYFSYTVAPRVVELNTESDDDEESDPAQPDI